MIGPLLRAVPVSLKDTEDKYQVCEDPGVKGPYQGPMVLSLDAWRSIVLITYLVTVDITQLYLG